MNEAGSLTQIGERGVFYFHFFLQSESKRGFSNLPCECIIEICFPTCIKLGECKTCWEFD